MRTYHLVNPPQVGGQDLIPLQTALHKAHIYNGGIDGIFGQSTGDACKRAKWRLGYPSRAVNHSGGQDLLNFLTGKKHLPPLYILRRRLRGYGLSKAAATRKTIVSYALWGVANNIPIHYSQSRPMDHLHKVKLLPWWSDCSEYWTTIYCWAKGPDPNGLDYNGEGWTGTMLQHGTTIPLYDAKPADLIIFGSYPGHHVVGIIDMTNKSDPQIVSHGQESGPKKYALSVEAAAQNRPYTVKRYIKD